MGETIFILTPNFAGGGAEFIAVALANQIQLEGKNPIIVCENEEGPFRDMVAENIRVIKVSGRNIFSITKKYRQIAKELRPTTVISTVRRSNVISGLAQLGLDKETSLLLLEVNTMDGLRRRTLLKRLLWIGLMNIAYANAYKIISCSNDVKQQLSKVVFTSKNIEVIGNPSLPNDYKSLMAQKAHHWPETFDHENIVFVSLGRLEEQKNFDFMLRSFSLLVKSNPNCRLLILGSGSQLNELQDLIITLNIQDYVVILPFQNNPYPYLLKSDVFLMTSKWEGFGNVYIMASACGLPIVSSDAPGGPRELIRDESIGQLYKLGDVGDFLSKCKRCISKLPASVKVIEKRRTHAERYKVDSVTKQYLDCVDKL